MIICTPHTLVLAYPLFLLKPEIDVLGQRLNKTGIRHNVKHTQTEFRFRTFSKYIRNKSSLEVVLNILIVAFALFSVRFLAFKLCFRSCE